MNWREWFAWHPVFTMGHRFAWLRRVERRLVKKTYWESIDVYDPGEMVSRYEYEYRMPKAEQKREQERATA